jgi:hypothetical protein
MNITEFLKNYSAHILSIIIGLIFLYVLNRPTVQNRLGEPTTIEHMDGGDLVSENANLKLLAKYLTLIIRKSEAQKELYTIETGKRQVYNSPTLVQLNRQITIFKEKIRSNPSALKYFDENLNITL